MTTIVGLLEKYQKIECLFFTKEIQEFKAELEGLRRELNYMIFNLEAETWKTTENKEAIRLLRNLVGTNR